MSPVYETYDQLDRFIRMVFSLVNYSIGRCGAGLMHDYYDTGALHTMRSIFGDAIVAGCRFDIQDRLDSLDVETIADKIAQVVPIPSTEWVAQEGPAAECGWGYWRTEPAPPFEDDERVEW